MTYYDFLDELNKPSFQPPAIVFKIVWPILYFLMFLSLYVFLNTEQNEMKSVGLWLFVIQLGLNIIWSPIFFYYRNISLALCVSVALTIVVGVMCYTFSKVSLVAGLLNIPYLIWLIFADCLNYSIWRMN